MTTGERQARRHPGEARIPAAAAVLVAIVLYASLPSDLVLGPRFVIPALEVLLFVPVLVANPTRMTRENRWLRGLSLGLVALIALTNAVALGQLVAALTSSETEGTQILLAAAQVWATNIIVFGLAFWELDRGGPVARTRLSHDDLPPADFRFPQDEDADAAPEVAEASSDASGWTPAFIDYLYVSVTNSSAFSPTDTMPLSPRVKLLMAMQSVSALLLSVLVISRGVSLLQ